MTSVVRTTLAAHRRNLGWVALWSVVEAVPTLLFGLLLTRAVERFAAGDVRGGLLVLAAFPAAIGVGAVATRRLLGHTGEIVEAVRESLITRIVVSALSQATSGGDPAVAGDNDMAALLIQAQAVRDLLAATLRSLRQVLFTAVAALVGLMLIAPVVAVLAAGFALASLGVFAGSVARLVRRHRALVEAEDHVVAVTSSGLAGMRDVVALGAQDRWAGDVAEASRRHAGRTAAVARSGLLRASVVFAGAQLPLLLLLAGTPGLIEAGHLTGAEVAGAAAYLGMALEPAIRDVVGIVTDAAAELSVLLARLDGAAPSVPPGDAPRARPPSAPVDVRLRDLAVGRAGTPPLAAGLNLALPPGSHLAVVGPSGAGKSTLAATLAGLLPPRGGAVLVGGTDIRSWPPEQARSVIALVPQEAYVFGASVRDNLAYLAPDAPDSAIEAAADALGQQQLLRRLGGLDAHLEPAGRTLSGAERQLVALIRTYLAPASIVILDEATSHLDPVTEAVIESAFSAPERGTVLVVVAHRITSAARAELVLLLGTGETLVGRHADLLQRSPANAELVRAETHSVRWKSARLA